MILLHHPLQCHLQQCMHVNVRVKVRTYLLFFTQKALNKVFGDKILSCDPSLKAKRYYLRKRYFLRK